MPGGGSREPIPSLKNSPKCQVCQNQTNQEALPLSHPSCRAGRLQCSLALNSEWQSCQLTCLSSWDFCHHVTFSPCTFFCAVFIFVPLWKPSLSSVSRVVTHDIPVDVIPRRLWHDYKEPSMPDFDVSGNTFTTKNASGQSKHLQLYISS